MHRAQIEPLTGDPRRSSVERHQGCRRRHATLRNTVLTDIAAADPRGLRAQVCVVGGGAAGITVATELARNGISVIVLEGGGRRF